MTKTKLQDMTNEPIGIAIASKNNLEYLKLCINSLKKNTRGPYGIYIVNDGSTDDTKEWLENLNHTEYNIKKIVNHNESIGLVLAQNESVELVDEKIFIIGHADMIFGKDWDVHYKAHVRPKRFTCLTRIEPPIYQAEDCKVQEPLGNFPDEFTEQGFDLLVDFLQFKNHKKTTYGQFAPYGGFKEDFMKFKLDRKIGRQTHEETNLFIELLTNGYELMQTWGGYVYHFGGRGTKLKGDNLNPQQYDEDYKKVQSGSFRNFFRKWSCAPIHNNWSYPEMPRIDYDPEADKMVTLGVSLCVLMKNEAENIYKFLEQNEPFFNEIIIVNDESTDGSLEEIERYKQETIDAKDIDGLPLNGYFNPDKIKVFTRPLNKDFASQKNFAVEQATNEWIMHLDCDEKMEPRFWWALCNLIKGAENQRLKVIGFPRANFIDGQQTKVYPDYQFRLHKKDIKWQGEVHERPELDEATTQIAQLHIIHEKSKEKHNKQNSFYNEIKEGAGNIIKDEDDLNVNE